MNIALITVIENNNNNLNQLSSDLYRKNGRYEDEAILCFKNWRSNAGWLKDINIYTYCPTKNVISNRTKEKLKELNVTYIENFIQETETYTCGFWNIPLCGKIFEEILLEDIFIHIDLDMNIIKEIPNRYIQDVYNNNIVYCGQYDDISSKTQRKYNNCWDLPLDTGFLISKRESKFYNFFYNELKYHTKTPDDIWKAQLLNGVHNDYLEEYVIDKAYNEKTFDIKPIKYYQLGEYYTKVSELNDTQLLSIMFWHEHINYNKDAYDKIREKLDYRKRIKNI